MELVVAGTEEFLLGFKLAGVRHTFNTEGNAVSIINEALEVDGAGVLVIDEDTMGSLPSHFREDLIERVSPVVVTLSTEGESSQLREKIVRAIGVDLWDR